MWELKVHRVGDWEGKKDVKYGRARQFWNAKALAYNGVWITRVSSDLMVWVFCRKALPQIWSRKLEKPKENPGEGGSFKSGHCLTSTSKLRSKVWELQMAAA